MVCFDFIFFCICNVLWKGSQRSIHLPVMCAQDKEEVIHILILIACDLCAEESNCYMVTLRFLGCIGSG